MPGVDARAGADGSVRGHQACGPIPWGPTAAAAPAARRLRRRSTRWRPTAGKCCHNTRAAWTCAAGMSIVCCADLIVGAAAPAARNGTEAAMDPPVHLPAAAGAVRSPHAQCICQHGLRMELHPGRRAQQSWSTSGPSVLCDGLRAGCILQSLYGGDSHCQLASAACGHDSRNASRNEQKLSISNLLPAVRALSWHPATERTPQSVVL